MKSQFSRDLLLLLEKLEAESLTLSDVLNGTSQRGFSLVIILLALPFLFPLPPGFSTVLGGSCLLLSLQMAIGRKVPWLPSRMGNFQFPKSFIRELLKNLKRFSNVVEKFAKPRWSNFAKNPHIWQINGLCIAWLSFLLMTPVPFTNPVPTLGILILAIAILEADGILMFLGYILVGLNTALFGSIAYLMWSSPTLLQNIYHKLSGG